MPLDFLFKSIVIGVPSSEREDIGVQTISSSEREDNDSCSLAVVLCGTQLLQLLSMVSVPVDGNDLLSSAKIFFFYFHCFYHLNFFFFYHFICHSFFYLL